MGEQEAMQVDAATNRLSQPRLHISQLLARPRVDQLEEKKWPALATLVVPSQLAVVSVPTLQRQTGRQVLSQSSCPRIRQLHQVLPGRGYPDVAMAGFNYEVVIAGNTYQVSGTSASAPVVAGFATLVNSRLAEQGKPTI